MIALSLDTDWSPDEVLAYALDIILAYPVKLTVFATHYTTLLKGLDPARVEIGVHPNFRPIALEDLEACRRTLGDLLEIYPEAKGVRCHSLVNSTPLLDLFASMGLRYENNVFMGCQPNLTPFRLWNGLVRIPLYWEDDLHCMYGGDFEVRRGLLDGNGTKVFSLHPPQIFMNVEKQSRYLASKPYYHQPEKLKEFRHTGQGTKTFAEDLCSYIAGHRLHTHTLSEIADATPLGVSWEGNSDSGAI